jgi:hypothetical protein
MSPIRESCLLYVSHVSYMWVISPTYESCLLYRSHVSYIWVMSRIYGSCLLYASHVSYMWVMSPNHHLRLSQGWCSTDGTKESKQPLNHVPPLELTWHNTFEPSLLHWIMSLNHVSSLLHWIMSLTWNLGSCSTSEQKKANYTTHYRRKQTKPHNRKTKTTQNSQHNMTHM